MTLNSSLFSSQKQSWNTPLEVLTPIWKEFGQIALDPCSNENSLTNALEQWYGPPQICGLTSDWNKNGLVFCNFPYDDAASWAKKIDLEASKGTEIIVLGPARIDTVWFQDFIYPKANCILGLKGRLKFVGAKHSAPFPSFLAYYGTRTSEFEKAFLGKGIWIKNGQLVSGTKASVEDQNLHHAESLFTMKE